MTQTIIGVLGLIVALIGLPFLYWEWKTKELRKDEVLAWSNDCIDVLQRTKLAIADAAGGRPAPDFATTMAELRARSSTQVERGRLFFRNVGDAHGGEKASAYKGYRVAILDCLVANSQVCNRAPQAAGNDLHALQHISEKYAKEFVSLAQSEIGRSRRSNSPAEDAGSSIDIDAEILEFRTAT